MKRITDKNLFLITHNFPFGKGETFLETELHYLKNEFENIVIISCNHKAPQTRNINTNIHVYRYSTKTNLWGVFKLPFLFLSNLAIISQLFREEIAFLRTSKKNIKPVHLKILLKSIIKAIQFKSFITHVLKTENKTGINILYSYWFSFSANAIGLLKANNIIKISRAHGSDIYEKANSFNYLPLLKFKCDALDQLYFISASGKKYVENKVNPANSNKLQLARLGVSGQEKQYKKTGAKKMPFNIVSCSNLIPLKRVHLLIEALAEIDSDQAIIWNHFGDGILFKELQIMAEQLIHKSQKQNIKYCFHGHVSNQDLLNYYSKNHIDLFVNVSKSEGVPVSIMEAMSFGIPVLATNVGGTNEIVNSKNGMLLDANPDIKDIIRGMNYFLLSGNINSFRESAYTTWNQNYNAEKNYKEFATKIKSLEYENQ